MRNFTSLMIGQKGMSIVRMNDLIDLIHQEEKMINSLITKLKAKREQLKS